MTKAHKVRMTSKITKTKSKEVEKAQATRVVVVVGIALAELKEDVHTPTIFYFFNHNFYRLK